MPNSRKLSTYERQRTPITCKAVNQRRLHLIIRAHAPVIPNACAPLKKMQVNHALPASPLSLAADISVSVYVPASNAHTSHRTEKHRQQQQRGASLSNSAPASSLINGRINRGLSRAIIVTRHKQICVEWFLVRDETQGLDGGRRCDRNLLAARSCSWL